MPNIGCFQRSWAVMDISTLCEKKLHPDIARFAQYCADLAGDRDMPRRSEFRPGRVSSMLGYIFLVDIIFETDDYRYSLFGVHLPKLYGIDLGGKKLSEVDDASARAFFRKTYDQVVEDGRPQYVSGQYVWPDRVIGVERLLVPMANDEGRLSSIIGLVIPDIPSDVLVVFAGVGMSRIVPDKKKR